MSEGEVKKKSPENIDEFWMVHGMGGNSPNYRHSNEASARTEATRLANAHPGQTFVVLHAIEAIKAIVNPAEKIEIIPESEVIPF